MAETDGTYGARSFLRMNAGIIYLAVIVAVPLVLASILFGLNAAFPLALLVLFTAVAFAAHRLRARRHPDRADTPGPTHPDRHPGDGCGVRAHPIGAVWQAKLSKAEIATLIAGLEKMPEFQSHQKYGRSGG